MVAVDFEASEDVTGSDWGRVPALSARSSREKKCITARLSLGRIGSGVDECMMED